MRRLLLALLLALPGCRGAHPEDPARVTLQVFAASSLTEAFGELERSFEAAHPGVDVRLTFAGSQVLRLQIEQGAAADVFASANPEHLQALRAEGHVAPPVDFATNELVVVVPLDDPAGVRSFADLPNARRLVIGAEAVPVGRYTRRLLDRAAETLGADFVAAVRARVVSVEHNVRLVRAKVELGEADAAIVYRTDAAATERVRVVEIPPALNVRARYPIAVTTRAAAPETAARFVAFVRSPAGRGALERHGFRAAP
ncbi:MAG: molybdate ABC transporter substrate-binding protein [Myxococcales bacterium]|nr:molybdate ABC transporter substrate-binding protein [Myxococcales bacterium]